VELRAIFLKILEALNSSIEKSPKKYAIRAVAPKTNAG